MYEMVTGRSPVFRCIMMLYSPRRATWLSKMATVRFRKITSNEASWSLTLSPQLKTLKRSMAELSAVQRMRLQWTDTGALEDKTAPVQEKTNFA